MGEEDALAIFARGYTLTRAGSVQLKYSRNHGTQSHFPPPLQTSSTQSSLAGLFPMSCTCFHHLYANCSAPSGGRGSGEPHLPSSCPWQGTSDSDSTGSGCADACQWGSLYYPDTCRWGLSLWFSWRTLCSLHNCTHRSAFLVTRKRHSVSYSCVYLGLSCKRTPWLSPRETGTSPRQWDRKQSRECRLDDRNQTKAE